MSIFCKEGQGKFSIMSWDAMSSPNTGVHVLGFKQSSLHAQAVWRLGAPTQEWARGIQLGDETIDTLTIWTSAIPIGTITIT